MKNQEKFDWTPERDELFKELYNEGILYADIADAVGCSLSMCSRHARKLGLNPRHTQDDRLIRGVKEYTTPEELNATYDRMYKVGEKIKYKGRKMEILQKTPHMLVLQNKHYKECVTKNELFTLKKQA